MDIKRYMKALPAVAALLLTAACSSSEDIETVETPQPAKERIIHFTAKVNNEDATRATLDGTQYNFVSGDKLYVWGTNISGELTTTNSGISATFEGDLTYTGTGEPGIITLNAVVKGASDQILGSLEDFETRGHVPSYTNGIASDKKDAVEKFSYLKASTNYDFTSTDPCDFGTPQQQSAFVSFDITLEDGTAAGQTFTATINNGGSDVRSGSVKTVSDGGVKAQFTAAFPDGTKLVGATVTLGTIDPFSFASSNPTLAANTNSTVKKSYGNYKMTVSATVGGMTKSKEKEFNVLSYVNEHTLQQLLENAGLEDVNVTSFTTKEGTNVTITNPDAISPNSYILKASAKGTTIFTIDGSANATIGGFTLPVPMPCDITVTVADK